MEVLSPLVGQEARGLEGLHLYHYGLSNCSQKVRMVLAEKGIGWTNHHLDLAKAEHQTEAYRRVHPNGVVPAIVDDGTIVIESSDIMEDLDERFPNPPLRPSREHDLVEMRLWVARQDSIQRELTILSREFVFKAIGAINGAAPPPWRPSSMPSGRGRTGFAHTTFVRYETDWPFRGRWRGGDSWRS